MGPQCFFVFNMEGSGLFLFPFRALQRPAVLPGPLEQGPPQGSKKLGSRNRLAVLLTKMDPTEFRS